MVSGWKKSYSDGAEMFFSSPFNAEDFYKSNLINIVGLTCYHKDYVAKLTGNGYFWYSEREKKNQRICKLMKLVSFEDRYISIVYKPYGLFYHVNYVCSSADFLSIPYWQEDNFLCIEVNMDTKVPQVNYIDRKDLEGEGSQ